MTQHTHLYLENFQVEHDRDHIRQHWYHDGGRQEQHPPVQSGHQATGLRVPPVVGAERPLVLVLGFFVAFFIFRGISQERAPFLHFDVFKFPELLLSRHGGFVRIRQARLDAPQRQVLAGRHGGGRLGELDDVPAPLRAPRCQVTLGPLLVLVAAVNNLLN